jgi:hypothetical protein
MSAISEIVESVQMMFSFLVRVLNSAVEKIVLVRSSLKQQNNTVLFILFELWSEDILKPTHNQ